MRYVIMGLVVVTAGCTNAPIAGFLDSCFPARTGDKPAPPPAPDRQPPPTGPAPAPAGPEALPPAADGLPSVAPPR